MMWKILPFFIALFVVGLGLLPPRGPVNIAITDKGFKKAENCAIKDYNRNSEDEHIYDVEKVLNATSQVIKDGMEYVMTLRFAKTSCRKTFPKPPCKIVESTHSANFIICTYTVDDIPRLGEPDVKDCNCKERAT